MKVGKHEKKEVSVLNNKLYLKAEEIMEAGSNVRTGSIGWSGVGEFIDWLEENYTIEKKEDPVEAGVHKILRGHLGDLDMAPELKLKESLRADSLDVVEIVMGLEEEFKISIDDRIFSGKDLTVKDLYEVVRSKT